MICYQYVIVKYLLCNKKLTSEIFVSLKYAKVYDNFAF